MKNKIWHVKLFIIPLLLILALSAAVAPRDALADGPNGFVIVTNNNSRTIHTIDTATNTVHGPFFTAGELGTSGHILDVALTHDGKTALIAHFGDKKVYFVDVSDPTSPVLLGHVGLTTIAPEDIAITHDDQFAVVTDGGPSGTGIVSIDINSRSEVDTKDATGGAQAVAIAPDGTVIVIGHASNSMETFTIDNAGALTFSASYTDGLSDPYNVDIAPDGQTVIVCNEHANTATVYLINGLGTLIPQGTVAGLPGKEQSVAFNQDGSKAYVLSIGPDPDQLSVLNITGPGAVSLETAGAATLFSNRDSFFGVDTITVAGNIAYVGGYPYAPSSTELAEVNLTNYDVSSVTVGNNPTGVDSYTPPPLPSPPTPLPPPPSPGGEVGITVMPMDKAGLLLPWLALAGLLVLGTGAGVLARRRIKR
jgi:DNA-binding beta-propeller fold protein YncE